MREPAQSTAGRQAHGSELISWCFQKSLVFPQCQGSEGATHRDSLCFPSTENLPASRGQPAGPDPAREPRELQGRGAGTAGSREHLMDGENSGI